MSQTVIIGERSYPVEVVSRRPLRLRVGGGVHSFETISCSPTGEIRLTLDGHAYQGWRYSQGDEVHVRVNGRSVVVHLSRLGEDEAAQDHAKSDVHAEMPGTIVAVECKPGQEVNAGDLLLTMESMKMQIGIVAPHKGVVKAVHFPVNAAFDRAALLVSLEPLEAA
jgi:acetyl/propionyl-CoA carboxylase alpha subunit